MARMDITKETGTTPEAIARHLLRTLDLDDVLGEYRSRLEAWIVRENGQDEFQEGAIITVPGAEDIMEITLVNFCVEGDGSGENRVPGRTAYKGWQLKRNGYLERVYTGYFTDENGLFILKDGRRVLWEEAQKTPELLFGFPSDTATAVLESILGRNDEPPLDSYETSGLIDSGNKIEAMPEVTFQALQINICYAGRGTAVVINNGTASSFYSIGFDETDMPIVVTRVGPEDAPRKLVIAGPHGDERNAQRLIMATQKHFIETGAPDNTVLYFIPCISPTMAFADVRGILNEHTAIGSITIPKLHNDITNDARNKLQSQPDRNGNFVGIDANRDRDLVLRSSVAFNTFIGNLKAAHARLNSGYAAPVVSFEDPADPSASIESPQDALKTISNFCVLMIHGYDSTQSGHGSVYGPYYVHQKNEALEWPARMSAEDKRYVNDIRDGLGWGKLSESMVGLKVDTRTNDLFLYEDTEHDARSYRGEWSLRLLAQWIWSADIELPPGSLDEGIRESPETARPYRPGRVGVLAPVDRQFLNLLNRFPWRVAE